MRSVLSCTEQFLVLFSPPTCRLLWQTGLSVAVRWLCTHFPKRRRQEESEWAQVWGHDGGFSSRQLEQEVCWHESWHAAFSRDTSLQSRKCIFVFKKLIRHEERVRVKLSFLFFPVTWQSRFQRGGPDSIPWCTLGDSSPDPKIQSLHKHTLKTNTEQKNTETHQI